MERQLFDINRIERMLKKVMFDILKNDEQKEGKCTFEIKGGGDWLFSITATKGEDESKYNLNIETNFSNKALTYKNENGLDFTNNVLREINETFENYKNLKKDKKDKYIEICMYCYEETVDVKYKNKGLRCCNSCLVHFQ
jgi:hypothetical protein